MTRIDLRSDTVTKPTPAMRRAMAAAEVGDDVMGDDPTVNRLEALAAEMLGKEAALFAPSGTQSNLLAVMTHCGRGDEYIVGQEAHTYKLEGGGAAVLGSVQPQPLDFEPDGTLDLDRVARAVKPDDFHFARTRLLCMEKRLSVVREAGSGRGARGAARPGHFAAIGIALFVAAGCRTAGTEPGRVPPPMRPGRTPPPSPANPAPQSRRAFPETNNPRPLPELEVETTTASTRSVDFRTVIAVQAYLDQRNLSCGCIDGAIGPRTRDAIQAWRLARGLPAFPGIDDALLSAMGATNRYYATHVVTDEERAALAPVPATWLGKSQVKRLGYESILELVAEKHHASERAIRRLNPAAAWPSPPTGTALLVPNPAPADAARPARIEIDQSQRTLRAFDDSGRLVALFPCSIARDAGKRPLGDLTIVRAASEPDYVFDPDVFPESDEARALRSKLVLPPGPNNPVGLVWLSLNRPGYGIHGSPHPEDVGKAESHGCFRLSNWNARKLLGMVHTGTPVTIRP